MSYINENIKDCLIHKEGEEEVRIVENFFSEDILSKIVHYFDDIGWKCQCGKDPNVSNNSGDQPYWRIELEKEEFFSIYLRDIIEKWFGKEMELNRIYVVGQTFGQNSLFHIDDENKNTYTFCFYINTDEEINEDGLFYLKIPYKKYIITIEPLINRMVIFPSSYKHKGCGFNKGNDNLRICIAWKFKIKNVK